MNRKAFWGIFVAAQLMAESAFALGARTVLLRG
jgi:hypothetical protein